jgi:molybdopterin converting factor small subunit
MSGRSGANEQVGMPLVVLRLFAGARHAAGAGRAEVRAATVGDVLAWARCEYGASFVAVLETSRVWRNGEPTDLDAGLADGDEVAVLPPVSGGASDPPERPPAQQEEVLSAVNITGSTPGYTQSVEIESVDAVLDPAFLHGLADLPLGEVRRRRDATDEVETGISYLRRLLQGRQDIMKAEQQRRMAGEAPGELADLVERLPEILAERVHAPGLGRLPQILAPGEIEPWLRDRFDAIVSPAQLADLPHCSDEELGFVADELGDFEREVSATRHALHGVLDQLKEEIIRRYQTGAANVDDLLSSAGASAGSPASGSANGNQATENQPIG